MAMMMVVNFMPDVVRHM